MDIYYIIKYFKNSLCKNIYKKIIYILNFLLSMYYKQIILIFLNSELLHIA